MKEKPENETSLKLPTADALSQALSYLQKANTPDELKLSDIKKAVSCIEEGEKEEDELLPEATVNGEESPDAFLMNEAKVSE